MKRTIQFLPNLKGIFERKTQKTKKTNELPTDLIEVTITLQRENNLATCPHCNAENRISKTFKIPAVWTCTRKTCQQLFKIIN